jgi:pimeloyl-ACP methyl ester carboxylesterase
MSYEYDYSGSIYRETRRYKHFRKSVLETVFGGGDWKEIVVDEDTGERVDEPLPANIFGPASGVSLDEVTINIQDGTQTTILKGALYTQTKTSKHGFYVIFMSGSGGPINTYAKGILSGYLCDPEINRFIKSVLCIDYRGFGLSRAKKVINVDTYKPSGAYLPGSRALYTDASAMIEFLNSHLNIPGDQIILHGYSLGSGPATQMSKDNKPHGGLVLHGPMHSVSFEAFNQFPGSKAAVFALTLGIWAGVAKLGAAIAHGNVGFVNIKKMRDINVPVLLTSGPNDQAWDAAKKLEEELLKHKKRVFLSVHNEDHLNTYAPFTTDSAGEKYPVVPHEKMKAFLRELLRRR